MLFIPKAGKHGHKCKEDCPPFSVTSFVLKALEHIADIHLRAIMDRTTFSKSQHARFKGKFKETTFHHTLGAFLDKSRIHNRNRIEGYFTQWIWNQDNPI